MRPSLPGGTALLILCVALAACGGQGKLPTQAASEQQAGGAAASAVGLAVDAAVSKLYGTNTIPIAWQPQAGEGMHDGPSFEHLALLRSAGVDDPPAPSPGGPAIVAKTDYLNTAWVSGTFSWSAAVAGLTTGWYHVTISFSPADPFKFQDADGNSVSIANGDVDIYVHDVLVSNNTAGTWSRRVDHYPTITAGAPLAITVTRADGVVHTYDVTGQRHAERDISRVKSVSGPTTTVTRTDAVTIDGDYSAAAGAGLGFTPVTYPTMPDRALTSQVFTKWLMTGTGTWAGHSVLWNRYSTYQIAWTSQFTTGEPTFTWDGMISNPNENVYITIDGGSLLGPYNAEDLLTRYGMHLNLNRANAGM